MARHAPRGWQQQQLLLRPLLLLLLLVLSPVSALHADRAGKEDWLKQHVGRLTRAVPTVRVRLFAGQT